MSKLIRDKLLTPLHNNKMNNYNKKIMTIWHNIIMTMILNKNKTNRIIITKKKIRVNKRTIIIFMKIKKLKKIK